MISRIYLAKLDPAPATVLDFLVARFPHVDRDTWIGRMERGLVRSGSGRRLTPLSPYAHGLTVTYERESASEPRIPFAIETAYRDERIIVVDKPHYLPVMPGGGHVEESVLARLRDATGIDALTPAHRLDRDTAGLVLFIIEPRHRGAYHRLFADGAIEKEYRAVAHVPERPDGREWRVKNRIEPSEPWFRMEVVDGAPNAVTHVILDGWRDGLGVFRLHPETGRKHQLRVHLASLGWPIVNDRYYPELDRTPDDDFSHPLQLLASRLTFTDPVSGERIDVRSSRRLVMELDE